MSVQDEGPNIKSTLSVIFNEQGDKELSELLDEARVEMEFLEHDNWDGGIDFYALVFWITPQRFAGIETRLDGLEKRISAKLGRLNLDRGGEQVRDVRISVDRVASPTAVRLQVPSPTDESRIWQAGKLRLFVSHISKIKIAAIELKAALEPLGVDAFVAHEDIEPARPWELEIEFALRSMHALCALVTPDFHASLWCDHEVGVALGRPVPVLPVRFGADPYGLMGKFQAIPRADPPEVMAQRIFDVLMKTESCRSFVVEGLVTSLESAHTDAMATRVASAVLSAKHFLSEDQIRRMLAATRENSRAGGASDVPAQIEAIAGAAGVTVSGEAFDDDIPF